MDAQTTDHFISLAKLLPISVPFFVWVTGVLAALCVFGICRELFRSRPFPNRGALVFLAISALPFALLWFGARMMHESVRDAQVWPSVVIWSVVLVALVVGVLALQRISGWKGAFVGVFALQFWLVLSTAFIADISVCGDYFRYLR
ncbi:hypothetical protein [Roseimicrobium sp. ORNL1]|uniref:hypothetical protein n=1 Tax=Roseimicrobium sp. ORNL1 TaxID=2711231 RepID=UPI0013E10B32|nr:hypothetical protein [Roseimicrobium sp. ORNL1]QIF02127.1 hypothetical protein G5S37_11475 [Roseimicrobium sp. ORNL1]